MPEIVESSADYVISGGGSAGCVLANRLTEQNDCSVILLEAGTRPTGLFAKMPAGVVKLMGNRDRNWMFSTEADPSIGGRKMIWHAGRMLGGSSSINGMVYTRGASHDYDGWAAQGCDGWSWADVLPLFLRSEKFEGPASPLHGKHGPLSVAASRNPHPLVRAFVKACTQVGLNRIEDYCSGDIDGVFENYVTQRQGQRSSTEQAFLAPAMRRANLSVITGALVDRILFEGTRAIGVQYVRDNQTHVVRAKKEVLLSAGAMQSPAILLRSGIGAASDLRGLEIPVVADRAQVGRNLQEHASFATSRLVNVPTFNTSAGPLRMPWNLAQYFALRRGLLTTAPVLAMASVRSDPLQQFPDIKLSMSPNCHDMSTMRPHEQAGMTIFANVSPPKSRGRILLRSRQPHDKPVIDHRLLGDADDMRALIAGLKQVDRIYRAPALASFVTAMNSPAQPPRDDAEWQDVIKARIGIGFHPVGTCRMGADNDAVVDPQLKVRGVEGLRVIDASIMPTMPMANTNAPTIMIGEKGAALVLRDPRQGD